MPEKAGSVPGGPPAPELLDKRLASCFPEVEKVQQPHTIVAKAGLSIQKRLAKLDGFKSELSAIIGALKGLPKPVDATLAEQTLVLLATFP